MHDSVLVRVAAAGLGGHGGLALSPAPEVVSALVAICQLVHLP